MEEFPCCFCGSFFVPSPRHKNQNYCMKQDCRRAKKAALKREKMRTDPEFRLNQQLSNKKWAKANPDYWKRYRQENPENEREYHPGNRQPREKETRTPGKGSP